MFLGKDVIYVYFFFELDVIGDFDGLQKRWCVVVFLCFNFVDIFMFVLGVGLVYCVVVGVIGYLVGVQFGIKDQDIC